MVRIILALVLALVLAVSVTPATQAADIYDYTGDVNGDGTVNALDASIIAAAYLSYPESRFYRPAVNARWDARADLNHDNLVNAWDWSIMAYYYGTNVGEQHPRPQ